MQLLWLCWITRFCQIQARPTKVSHTAILPLMKLVNVDVLFYLFRLRQHLVFICPPKKFHIIDRIILYFIRPFLANLSYNGDHPIIPSIPMQHTIQYTYPPHQYSIPMQNTNASYLCSISMHHTYASYQCRIPIRHTYAAYQFSIPIRHTYEAYQFRTPNRHTYLWSIPMQYTYKTYLWSILMQHTLVLLPSTPAGNHRPAGSHQTGLPPTP